MKAICIKKYDFYVKDELEKKRGKTPNSRMTIGKVYEILSDNDNDYFFVDDNGDELWYKPDYFISLEQHRENQINKLLE